MAPLLVLTFATACGGNSHQGAVDAGAPTDGMATGGDDAIGPVKSTFDPSYFYCVVEPSFLGAYKCGPGDPAAGDMGSCHYSAAVSGMALVQHPAVMCTAGSPTDPTQIASGSPAAGNYQGASLEMLVDYQAAPIFVRPAGTQHPRAIFSPSDPTVNEILSTWAKK